MFTARGTEVQENINKKKVDLKNVYYRMKSGESAKVRLLGTTDYVEYISHGSFSHKVYTQPCVAVIGKECPLCIASKSGVEGFDALYPRKRYVFVFADLVSGELKALDVSKNQAKKLIEDIVEYTDEINEIAFNLKKTGESTNTIYSLNPILKMKGQEPVQFEAGADLEVTDEFLNSVLVPRSEELQIKTLAEAGFPVEEYFAKVVATSVAVTEESDPTDQVLQSM